MPRKDGDVGGEGKVSFFHLFFMFSISGVFFSVSKFSYIFMCIPWRFFFFSDGSWNLNDEPLTDVSMSICTYVHERPAVAESIHTQ
jgi:hypothetical protein